ncbi:MAG TPA: hypothetical protein V6D29_08305 [Leptolyngbyaceae cyanobacterium]
MAEHMLALSMLGLVGTLGFLVVLAMFARSLAMFGEIWELAEADDSPWMMPDVEAPDTPRELLQQQSNLDYMVQEDPVSSILQDVLVISSLQDSLAPSSTTTPSVG